jgi:hypothetical protein
METPFKTIKKIKRRLKKINAQSLTYDKILAEKSILSIVRLIKSNPNQDN